MSEYISLIGCDKSVVSVVDMIGLAPVMKLAVLDVVGNAHI